MKRFAPAPVAGRGKKEKMEDGDEPPVHIKEKLMRYGNTPEENERWRRDRKAAFPVQKKAATAVSVVESPPIPVAPAPAVVVNNHGGGLAAMFALYVSDDDEEEEKEEPNVEAITAYSPEESNVTATTTTTVILVDDPNELQLEDDTIQQVEKEGTAPSPSAPCRFFAKTGKCKFGDKCKNLHDKDSVTVKKSETVKKQTKESKLAAATHKFSKQALLNKLFIKVRERKGMHIN